MWRFSFRHISSHLPSFAIPFVTRLATAPTATGFNFINSDMLSAFIPPVSINGKSEHRPCAHESSAVKYFVQLFYYTARLFNSMRIARIKLYLKEAHAAVV